MLINKADISGMVVETRPDMIIFRQKVGGRIDTDFRLFLPGSLRAGIAEMQLQVGSMILVQNAQLYEKDGEFRLRIKSVEDLLLLNEPQDYFLGEEDAKERFI